MKKFLIILSVVLVVVIAAAFYPAKNAPQDDNTLPFNAYCPVFVEHIPTLKIVDLLDGQQFHKYVPNLITICIMKEAIGRAEAQPDLDTDQLNLQSMDLERYDDELRTFGNAIGTLVGHYNSIVPANRPDLRVYFLEKIIKVDVTLASLRDVLGYHYSMGLGIAQDKEKAKRLYREALLSSFKYNDTPEECVQKEEKGLQSKLRHVQKAHGKRYLANIKYVTDPFYIEQVRWIQNLCHKTPDELFELAQWYFDKDNLERTPRMAFWLAYALPYPYEKMHDFMDRVSAEIWP